MVLLRNKLVALFSSPLSSLRLPADAYYAISSLGIASWRTHSGCRSGKSARRARVAKRFLPVGLINANSANNQVLLIAHFIQSNNLDILVITELSFRWQTVLTMPVLYTQRVSHRFKYLVIVFIVAVALRCSTVMLLLQLTNTNVYHTLALLRSRYVTGIDSQLCCCSSSGCLSSTKVECVMFHTGIFRVT